MELIGFAIIQILEIKNRRDSKPNLNFKSLLEQNGFKIDENENREFVLNNYVYDFKINNILIEINPTTTHNSTFGIYNGSPINEQYHYNKTKNALDNGYKCICVWDWIDQNSIIQKLKNNNFTQEYIGIRKHLYNIKTKEHIIINNNSNIDINDYKLPWVIIFDDGYQN